jgi:hypothetical protein
MQSFKITSTQWRSISDSLCSQLLPFFRTTPYSRPINNSAPSIKGPKSIWPRALHSLSPASRVIGNISQ